jgi:hypothetical protein
MTHFYRSLGKRWNLIWLWIWSLKRINAKDNNVSKVSPFKIDTVDDIKEVNAGKSKMKENLGLVLVWYSINMNPKDLDALMDEYIEENKEHRDSQDDEHKKPKEKYGKKRTHD